MNPLIDHLAGEVARLKAAGTYKEELVLESPQDARVRVNGRDVVMLTSNNYLGLTQHPEVVEAARAAVATFGTGTTGSRTANGTLAMHEELEQDLADWFGKRHAIIFSTGYQANLSLVGALCGADDVILIDRDSHASIYDATRQTASQVIGFRHNSPGGNHKPAAGRRYPRRCAAHGLWRKLQSLANHASLPS